MKIYSIDIDNLTEIANQVKEVLLDKLEREGVAINSKELSETYAVVITRPGMLGKIIQKHIGKGDTELFISVVKFIK
jgi:hypothetical protein